MSNLVIYLFYISSAFLSSNVYQEDNQVLTKFITAFNEETTIQNWLNETNRICICATDLFIGVLRKISDVLAVINNDDYVDIKYLILETNITFENAGIPFHETIYIFDSVKRILKIRDKLNASNLVKCKDFNLSKEILNEEYEQIHESLTNTIFYIGKDDNLDRKYAELDDLVESGFNKKYLSLIWKRQLPTIKNYLNISNDMLESILPINNETPVYVESCFEGLECSRKCSGYGIKCFEMDKSTPILPDNNLKMRVECDRRSSGLKPNTVNINNYMDKTFVCNKIMAKVFIILFHYYSEIKGKNTKYEIVKNDNKYLIRWSFSNLSLLEPIKKYWLQRDLDEYDKNFIKMPMFSSKINFDEIYSTEKSEDTENEPIKTRLIILCCRHQLGFKLIDEYIENIYCKDPINPKCHVCKENGVIKGSYDAEVYKYKQSTLS